MQRVAIFGAGALGRSILQIVRALAGAGTQVECIGFLVDEGFRTAPAVQHIPVFTGLGFLAEHSDVEVIIGIGSPAARLRVAREIESAIGPRFATLVHPKAFLEESVTLGYGSAVLPGLLTGSDVAIGAHVYTGHHVHLGHDVVLGDFASLAPGTLIAGGSKVGEGADFGMGAIVLPNTRIGAWSRIGAGSLVNKDVPENAIVAGMPARVVSHREPGWQLAG